MTDKKDPKNKGRNMDDYMRLLKFYYLPVFVLAIFFAVMMFGLIPSLGSLYDNYAKRNSLKKEVDRHEETIAGLLQLKNDSNQTNEYLQSVNKIAPVEQTTVTDFQESIKALATANSIATLQANTRELIFTQDGGQEVTTNYLQLIEVPSEFVFSGNFQNIKQFLGKLYEQDEFIVIEEMSFSKAKDSSDWQLNIILNKYQFSVNENATSTSPSYLSVPETAKPNQEVIDFINDKYLISPSE